MAGTKEGFKKTRKTLVEMYGGEEGYMEAVRRRGSKGGRVKSPLKGFGSMDKEKVRAAGRAGGLKSRKG